MGIQLFKAPQVLWMKKLACNVPSIHLLEKICECFMNIQNTKKPITVNYVFVGLALVGKDMC
jgi:hypothetical protein